jgi:hypothetical protein
VTKQETEVALDDATCSRILNALRRLYEAADVYVASQDRATDECCGLVQPITVADGNELIAAQCEALEILQSAERQGWVYSANSGVRMVPATETTANPTIRGARQTPKHPTNQNQ